MRHCCKHATMRTGRRSFLLGTAGAVAAGVVTSVSPGRASEDSSELLHSRKHVQPPLPEPKPIPGGTAFPPDIFIHELFPPGDDHASFTLVTLQGLNVEPSTITDFKGVTVLAYHVGSATGSDGNTYDLETDIRVMQGDYIALNGEQQEGTFAEL